jgi:hypothetical protein
MLHFSRSHPFSLTESTSLFDATLDVMFRPESFAASNATLLNAENQFDLVWFMRHTADLAFDIIDKMAIIEFNVVFRNKTVWGNYGSVGKTSRSTFKIVDAITGEHDHALLRNFFHARELWMRIDLGQVFSMPFEGTHYLTIGSFPFQLGRGIALGDAFAVGPETIGFYSDTVVDQFAYGLLFSGNLCKDILDYAFYFALLESKTDSFANTSAKVRAQQYGRRQNPERGFGVINYIFAGNLDWYAMSSEDWGSLRFQPYWLFNETKEQRVEFVGDASSRLGTIGMECDYLGRTVEFGIESAFNLGAQCVRGWDRNDVILQDDGGYVAQVNSQVIDSDGNNIPFIANGTAQNAIFNTLQSESENGAHIPGDFPTIGFLDPVDGEIFNSKIRFRNPYTNTYKGWMLVTDASWWVYRKDLRVSATIAYASGDDNPNFDTRDGDFKGFISLQEIYSGKRVKSAFLLGGAGKVVRPIANPIAVETSNILTKTVSGFTNLIFGGLALAWTPSDWDRPFKFNPNVLVYWQDATIPEVVASGPAPLASRFLGTEVNIFADCNVAKNLKLFCVSSAFIPGGFFRDIKGRKIMQAQILALLDSKDSTGYTKDAVPALGDSMAFTFNIGMEYRF